MSNYFEIFSFSLLRIHRRCRWRHHRCTVGHKTSSLIWLGDNLSASPPPQKKSQFQFGSSLIIIQTEKPLRSLSVDTLTHRPKDWAKREFHLFKDFFYHQYLHREVCSDLCFFKLAKLWKLIFGSDYTHKKIMNRFPEKNWLRNIEEKNGCKSFTLLLCKNTFPARTATVAVGVYDIIVRSSMYNNGQFKFKIVKYPKQNGRLLLT